MIKSAMRNLQKKFFGHNPMLDMTMRKIFRTNPFKAALLSLYEFPVRDVLKASDEVILSKRTFTVSKEYYEELHRLLHVAKAEDYELIRIGSGNDGGYVMLDDLPGGVAYSFGICNDVSWDKDMAERGYDVFMYDHTIDGLPEQNPRFHWTKLGIADGLTDDDRLKTLEELISRNGHENQSGMILKMDVEGAEWGFLERVKPETLAKFNQITLELHDVINPSSLERVLNALRKINATHQLVHLHGNNSGTYLAAGGKNFCTLFEVSYILRGKYKISQDYDVKLPLKIDMPNLKSYPEIELGFWNRNMKIDDTLTLAVKVF